jgi:hypothetical protein
LVPKKNFSGELSGKELSGSGENASGDDLFSIEPFCDPTKIFRPSLEIVTAISNDPSLAFSLLSSSYIAKINILSIACIHSIAEPNQFTREMLIKMKKNVNITISGFKEKSDLFNKQKLFIVFLVLPKQLFRGCFLFHINISTA